MNIETTSIYEISDNDIFYTDKKLKNSYAE